MPKQTIPLDDVFYALADPTRRAVLERLSDCPAPDTILAQPFDMALPSLTQHLNVLEDCGLVRSDKTGRVRTYRIDPRPLKAADRWMVKHRAMWESRLDQLDSYLNTMKEQPR